MKCLKPIRLKTDRMCGNVFVPCGKCASCMYNQIQDKILRFTLWSEYSNTPLFFITLTYDENNLPKEGVNKEDVQKFIKRLRHKTRDKIEYYFISEYGSKTKRAHYHAILNGFKDINHLYNSLSTTWKYGNFQIGIINKNRMQYVAKYHVTRLEAPFLQNKCFSLCSKGIGKEYLTNENISYHHAYQNNTMKYNVTLNRHGKSFKLPRYLKEKIFSKHDLNVMRLHTIEHLFEMKSTYSSGLQVKQWVERFYKYYGKKVQL